MFPDLPTVSGLLGFACSVRFAYVSVLLGFGFVVVSFVGVTLGIFRFLWVWYNTGISSVSCCVV